MEPSDRSRIPALILRPLAAPPPSNRFGAWLMRNQVHPVGPETADPGGSTHSWWKVMCLTGVDYFSTLSYLPSIAIVAAGALSPLATLVIVVLTLLGMLPMYRRVAVESPHGQGSVAMLERLLPFWRGKVFVLVLLGFVATSWIITITLSSADATVHLLENPAAPEFLRGLAVPVTIGFLLVLGGVFLLGFREAVTIAIPLVGVFLLLNGIVIVVGLVEVVAEPDAWANWLGALRLDEGGPGDILGPVLLAFPLLVLGLSGFETGVSMMPLVASRGQTPEERLASRVRNTRRLLTLAALIMSVYLLASSVVTTVLIPAEAFDEGGPANGRALSYLAHEYIGNGFGNVYDLSSIFILWFAGASAMAGLINIVPRYLPGYGMAPEWSRAVRPVVLVYTGLSILITIGFRASVDAQAGAYATGILAMMVSAAAAVTVSAARRRERWGIVGFGALTIVLLYALGANIIEKPDGIMISALFIGGIVLVSLVSRVSRTTELRVEGVEFDEAARQFIADSIAFDGALNIVANKPQSSGHGSYAEKENEQRGMNPVPGTADVLFLEIEVVDPSSFRDTLHVRGVEVGEFRVLHARSPAVPNAIAAILLALREATGLRPHAYFEWSEGNPVGHLLRYLLLGQGDTAPVVREILRESEPDAARRPGIHVGGG
nr:APC family permease [Cryobacterium sp. N22]